MKEARAAVDSDRQQTERTPHKFFTCLYVDNLTFKCTKLT